MTNDQSVEPWCYDDLLSCVETLDWQVADEQRAHIEYDEVGEYLIQDYWMFKEWPQRLLMAHLLSALPAGEDYLGPHGIWFDVLRAPRATSGWDDQTDFTKIEALAKMAERYDRASTKTVNC